LLAPIAQKTGGMAAAGYSAAFGSIGSPAGASTETSVTRGIANGIGLSAVLWVAAVLIFI
jgi:hypothetical protein